MPTKKRNIKAEVVESKAEHPVSLQEVRAFISQLPDYIQVTGSASRGKKFPGDIDLLSLEPLDKIHKFIENHFDILKVLSKGNVSRFLVIKLNGKPVEVNIWYSTKEDLPYKHLQYDYPKGHVIALRKRMKDLGYRLTDKGLFKGSRRLNKTPREIYQMADKGFVYRTPEQYGEYKGEGLTPLEGAIESAFLEGDGLINDNPDDLIKVKPRSAWDRGIKKAIKTIASKPKNVVPFGSWIYSTQLYPGDIDLIEVEEACCGRDEAIRKFVRRTQDLVKKIKKTRGSYLGDVKAGFDEAFLVNIGKLQYDPEGRPVIVGYDPVSVRENLEELHKEEYLPTEEYKRLRSLVKDNPISQMDFETLEEALRDKWLLRWTEDELLKGFKMLPGDRKYTLGEAISEPTMLKIDMWTTVNGKFMELSNVLTYYLVNEDGTRHLLNFKNETIDLDHILSYEVQKYAFSNLFFKPFKMVKRMWSMARLRKDFPMVEKLTPIMQSDLGRMSQVYSEITVMIDMIETLSTLPWASILKAIDSWKMRLSNVYEVDLGEETLDKYLDRLSGSKLNNKKNRDKVLKGLKRLKIFFSEKISTNTIKVLQKEGLYPPPLEYLPQGSDLEGGVIASEHDQLNKWIDRFTEKLMKNRKGGSIASKLFQTGTNVYRALKCNGKARPLLDGELHPSCYNFCGPGTRIDLAKVRNFPPYNEVDAVCRTHDLDYNNAKGKPNRQELIRKADEKMLKALNTTHSGKEGADIARLAITSKVLAEDLAPNLVERYAPNYRGRKAGGQFEGQRTLTNPSENPSILPIEREPEPEIYIREDDPCDRCRKLGRDCERCQPSTTEAYRQKIRSRIVK